MNIADLFYTYNTIIATMSAFNFIDEYKTDDPKLGHIITKGRPSFTETHKIAN